MTDAPDDSGMIDTSRPHPARMYDYYLQGKDHYPADAAAAEQVLALVPHGRAAALANRRFMHRAVRGLAQQGVRQFLDVGTGIPTEPNLHQVAQGVAPDTRVAYVDNDPIVLRHAEALLRGTPEGRTEYIQADVRDPDTILEGARSVLDFDQPIALSLVALLHFVPDEHDPRGILARLLEPLAPGSHLVLSHGTGDRDPAATVERVVEIYRNGGVPLQMRSRAEFAAFFDGLELIGPGVQLVSDWNPEPGDQEPGGMPAPLYGGVAVKV
ncbi:SAM-dependent methyltransferase [Streptomyces sp. NPDC055078]